MVNQHEGAARSAEQPRERRVRVRPLDRLEERLGLRLAKGNHDDPSGAREHGHREREATGRRFGRIPDAQHQVLFIETRRMAGKERGHVTVRADAEQHEVQPHRPTEAASELRRVARGGARQIWIVGRHAVDIAG